MQYVVMATWYGIEDPYSEEYSGIRHNTREEARAELIEAKNDINYDNFFIIEVKDEKRRFIIEYWIGSSIDSAYINAENEEGAVDKLFSHFKDNKRHPEIISVREVK